MERVHFVVEGSRWQELNGSCLKEQMVSVLRDWGTALDVALYDEVASHFCGLRENSWGEVAVSVGGRRLGVQGIRLAAPDVALRTSALLPENLPALETHLRRLREYTPLRAIQWINIAPRQVRFATIQRSRGS